MDNNPSGKEQRKAEKAIQDNKVVAADNDDNTLHLENMANVQGSNKSSGNNSPSQNRNVEKEVNSKTNTGVEA